MELTILKDIVIIFALSTFVNLSPKYYSLTIFVLNPEFDLIRELNKLII